jgi:hypothetical protein
MKNLKSLLVVAFSAVLLIGCAESSDQTSSVRKGNRGTRNAGGTATSPNSSAAWSGVVYGSPQNSFQEATEDFVSSFMNPNELGEVSGQFNQTTGVRVTAQLSTAGFNGNNLNGLQVSGGNLNILIFDSYAQSGQAEAIVISTLNFNRVEALSGGALDFQFSDAYSTVTMWGNIQGNYFVGAIRFINKKHFNGGTPASWSTWAGVQIPKCDLLNCN